MEGTSGIGEATARRLVAAGFGVIPQFDFVAGNFVFNLNFLFSHDFLASCRINGDTFQMMIKPAVGFLPGTITFDVAKLNFETFKDAS